MAIDIEDLTTPQRDALREAFGPLVGMQLIASGDIPVGGATWEIDLDAEYERYHLACYRTTNSNNGGDLCFRFSAGATDYEGAEDYLNSGWYFLGDPDGTNDQANENGFLEDKGYVAYTENFIMDIWHNPGARNAHIKSDFLNYNATGNGLLGWETNIALLRAATGPVDKITLFYSGEQTFTGGKYVLWAVKA